MATKAKRKPKPGTLKKLEEKLLFTKKSAWEGIKAKEHKEISELCEAYKSFLDSSKTEREAIATIGDLSKPLGFTNIKNAKKTAKKLFCSW